MSIYCDQKGSECGAFSLFSTCPELWGEELLAPLGQEETETRGSELTGPR